MKLTKVAALLLLFLTTAAFTSCTGDDDRIPGGDGSISSGDDLLDMYRCDPEDVMVGVGEMAAPVPLTCLTFLDVAGEQYYLRGCLPVEPSFLGPITARSDRFAARSIEGDEDELAVAVRVLDPAFPYDLPCGRWTIWPRIDLSKREKRLLWVRVCHVMPEESAAEFRYCRLRRLGGAIPDPVVDV